MARSVGRRLSDGAEVEEKRTFPRTAVLALFAALALGCCPTHDSFTAYLADAAAHPSGFLGSVSALAERVRIAVTAESDSMIFFRIGKFRSQNFLGCFGTWVWLPAPVFLPAEISQAVTASVCGGGGGGGSPHEAFVLLCIVGFGLWQLAPQFM